MMINELHHGGIRALLDYDNTLFDNMQLPEGVDLNDVVNHILYTYGDTPLYTPEPTVLKYYMAKWSARRLPLWQKYQALLAIEYDPLSNYDRIENTTRANTGTQTDKRTGDDTLTMSGSEKTQRTGSDDVSYAGTETTTNSRSAFNSAAWEADNRSERAYGSGRTDTYDYGSTDTRSFTGRSDQTTYNSQNQRTDNLTETVTSNIRGNIGVTTSQQMFMAEVGVIPYYDLINYIAQDWHQEFCLGLYY